MNASQVGAFDKDRGAGRHRLTETEFRIRNSANGNHLRLVLHRTSSSQSLKDAFRQMSHGRDFLSVATNGDSLARLRDRRRIAALAFLALALGGCGSRSAPLSQPLDAGQQAQAGTDRHLAENGDHERVLPNGPAAQGGGDLLTNGAHPPLAGPAMPSPPQLAPPAQAGDAPTQPADAEPLLDAGGFDPTPQGGGEIDHSAGNSDSTTAGGLHN